MEVRIPFSVDFDGIIGEHHVFLVRLLQMTRVWAAHSNFIAVSNLVIRMSFVNQILEEGNILEAQHP